MADKSAIEWTDATWNPVRGCSIVSPGCTNCYAMRQAHRHNHPDGAYFSLTMMTKGGPVWTGDVRTVPELLTQPIEWKRPRRIFVNSMSDLFHPDVPGDFIDAVIDTVKRCNHLGRGHKFQVLTKRAERMQRFLRHYRAIDNLWLGVSVEDQRRADERIPLLLETPAAVRWISAEPLLGPVALKSEWLTGAFALPGQGIEWMVVGGESGPGARPLHPDWARSLRDQCAAAGIPFFFKQWGTWFYEGDGPTPTVGRTRFFPDLGSRFSRWSKRTTGRELDGRMHEEYPA